jgi:hypothetical protein
MALPELVKLTVEKKLSEYCRKKVPPHVADQLKVGFRFRGNSVTLFEARPQFSDPRQWVEIPIAQCRFDPETAQWSLYCADRNSRWHRYVDLAPSKNFEKLLQVIDNDPTGIFWG